MHMFLIKECWNFYAGALVRSLALKLEFPLRFRTYYACQQLFSPFD
jgi:hypothetical protein